MDIERIQHKNFKPVIQSYDKRDSILYALGLGFGVDPLNEKELPFVFEKNLQAVPTFCHTICHPGFWAQKPEYGIDWVKILHAEQALLIHQPIAYAGTLRGEYRVAAIEDKGRDRGALLHQEKILFDNETNEKLATVRSTLFMRGNGGEGGFGDPVAPPAAFPEKQADKIIEITTRKDQALIYRLSGDWNPLHADPEIAQKAGFSMPILQGLCTKGIACRAILQCYCDFDATRLKSMFVRFSKPLFPGETIRFEFFEEQDSLRFRAIAIERNVIVLDKCSAVIV